MLPLKEILQPELHDSPQASALDAAEQGTVQVSTGIHEGRVIQDVGPFRAKLHGLRFLEFEYPRQAGIDRPTLRTERSAWSHIAVIAHRRYSECIGVYPQEAKISSPH